MWLLLLGQVFSHLRAAQLGFLPGFQINNGDSPADAEDVGNLYTRFAKQLRELGVVGGKLMGRIEVLVRSDTR
jgi:hypothetical protein